MPNESRAGAQPARRRRKPPQERRTEIVDTACRLIVANGVRNLTLRAVADELAVTPGLISHYFPSVDDLVVEAFAGIVDQQGEASFIDRDVTDTPTGQLRRMFDYRRHVKEVPAPVFWIDAWYAAHTWPRLRDEVVRQMEKTQLIITGIIEAGIETGEFTAADPKASALRILAAIDETIIIAALGIEDRFLIAADFVLDTTERELGLAPGTLRVTPE